MMNKYSAGVAVVFTAQQALVASLRSYDDSDGCQCDSFTYLESWLNVCSLTRDVEVIVQIKQLLEATLVLLLLTRAAKSQAIFPESFGTPRGADGQAKIPGQREYDAYQRRALPHAAVLTCCFLLDYFSAIWIAAKCVVFRFGAEEPQRRILSALVVSNLFSFISMRQLLRRTICPAGIRHRPLHRHALYYQPTAEEDADCECCDDSFEDKPHVYVCSYCDATYCLDCFRGKDKDEKLREETTETVSIKTIVLQALALAKPWKAVLGGALLISLVSSCLDFYVPLLQGDTLNAIWGNESIALYGQVFWIAVIGISGTFFSQLHSSAILVFKADANRRLRNRLLRKIIYQGLDFHDSTERYTLSQVLESDVREMNRPWRIVCSTLVRHVGLTFAGLVVCWRTSWRLTLLATALYGPFFYAKSIYNKQVDSAYDSSSKFSREAVRASEEMIRYVRMIKAFSSEEQHLKKYERCTGKEARQERKVAYLFSAATLLDRAVSTLARMIVLAAGGYLVQRSRDDPDGLSTGALVSFQLYLEHMCFSISVLFEESTSLARSAAAAERVVRLLETHPDVDPSRGILMDKLKRALCIDFRNVSFAYPGSNVNVIRKLNLIIPANTTCALVGKSGSGKTTILNLLLRLYELPPNTVNDGGPSTHPKIFVGGDDIAQLNLKSYHDIIGHVSQETHIVSGTVLSNITYGLESESVSAKDVEVACRKAHAHEFIEKLDQGYNTPVGVDGVRLSGGQKQRIALARVFLRKPKILLLDEATSALDAISEALVQESIDRLLSEGGCTVMLVAHRLSTVVNADNIVVIEGGEIVEQGTHHQLLKRPDGLYRELMMKQRIQEANELSNLETSGAKAPGDES